MQIKSFQGHGSTCRSKLQIDREVVSAQHLFWLIKKLILLHTKHLPPYHGHLINDEVMNACHTPLNGLQTVTFDLFEDFFDRKSQQGVEGVAINIECNHSSCSSDA